MGNRDRIETDDTIRSGTVHRLETALFRNRRHYNSFHDTACSQTTQTKTSIFTSSTELVLIPTVVHDKSGSHIAGLTKVDFVLKQDGKNHPIAVFEEVRTSSAREHRSEGGQATYSNFEPEGGDHRRLSIIVLDFVNTPPSDQANARQALLKFLLEVAESGEPTCLLALTRGGLTLVHNFTDDPKVLAEGVRKVEFNTAPLAHEPVVYSGHPPPSDALGAMITKLIRGHLESENQLTSLVAKDQALITVQALLQIAKAFRGFPGRKALIWTSSGFPFSLSSPATLMCEPACPVQQRGEVQSAYDNLWRMMSDAQIAIYSVDLRASSSRTLAASSADFTHPYDIGDPQFDTDAQAKWKFEDTSDTLQFFANNTGGKAFLGGNNLVESFRQAIQDDSSYYVLGYYVSPSNTKLGWHDVSVAVHVKGAQTRHRNGFFLFRDTSTNSARQDVQLALNSPLDFTGVAVSVTWSGNVPSKIQGKTKVQFDLVMPPNFASVDESDENHMVVDIVARAKNRNGDVIADLSQRIDVHLKSDGLGQIRQNGMTYRNGLQLPPGEYSVRFVVRDAIGNRMGSVAAPIKLAP
jgi:VWFA-related protein